MRWWRPARIAAALLIGACWAGCARKESPTQPAVEPLAPPELKAYELFLDWGSYHIGPGSTHLSSPAARYRATRGSADDAELVVVGTGALPTLRMTSTVPSSSDYHVYFFDNDSLWWDVSAAQRPIPPGWYDLGGLPWVPADTGLHVLRAVIDPTHRVDETDESNNEARLSVHVIPGDLVAGTIRFIVWNQGYPYDVTSVKVGTPISIIAESFAHGVYANHRAVLDACGSVLLDHRVTLAGGTLFPSIRDDTLAFTPSKVGDCLVRFTVDPDDEFPMDSNRSDNVSERTLTVGP